MAFPLPAKYAFKRANWFYHSLYKKKIQLHFPFEQVLQKEIRDVQEKCNFQAVHIESSLELWGTSSLKKVEANIKCEQACVVM